MNISDERPPAAVHLGHAQRLQIRKIAEIGRDLSLKVVAAKIPGAEGENKVPFLS